MNPFFKVLQNKPSLNRFFWQGVKRQNSRQPTHDYQQPICLSNKCHHLLQLQSSSRGRTKRIELLSTTIITSYLSSLFFESRASLYLSLNMMMKISICQKKKRKKSKITIILNKIRYSSSSSWFEITRSNLKTSTKENSLKGK